jgi:hypothetical protein
MKFALDQVDRKLYRGIDDFHNQNKRYGGAEDGCLYQAETQVYSEQYEKYGSEKMDAHVALGP